METTPVKLNLSPTLHQKINVFLKIFFPKICSKFGLTCPKDHAAELGFRMICFGADSSNERSASSMVSLGRGNLSPLAAIGSAHVTCFSLLATSTGVT